jgi:S-formylglutathione hydrolase FrmB
MNSPSSWYVAPPRYLLHVQPVDGLFIALMVLLTVGALVMTVWSWNWARLRFARRVAALGATQVMVVLCVVAGVNASQDFFVTWDDVLSGGAAADPGALPVTALAPRADTSAVRQTVVSTESQLQSAVDAAEISHRKHPSRGVMVATQIRGARTGYTLPARLYLPAAYFDQSDPDRVFPVVQFLTGYYGGLDIFQRTFGGDRMLDKLIAEKKMPPVVVVIPEQNPSLPRDSECVNAVGGDQAETYLAEDVPDVIRNDLRVSRHRARWTLMGYSTGGFCAANLAIHHPDRYATVVSLSGYFHAVTDASTGDLYQGDEAARLANTPSHTVTLPRKYPLHFYIATATGDGEGVRGLKELSPKITAPDVLTKAVNGNSGHNFNTWRRQLPLAFTWLGGQLAKPVTPLRALPPVNHGAQRFESVAGASPSQSPSATPGPVPGSSADAKGPGVPAFAPPANAGGLAAGGTAQNPTPGSAPHSLAPSASASPRGATPSAPPAQPPIEAAAPEARQLIGPQLPPSAPAVTRTGGADAAPSAFTASAELPPVTPASERRPIYPPANPVAVAPANLLADPAAVPPAEAQADPMAGVGWPNVWLPSNGFNAAG